MSGADKENDFVGEVIEFAGASLTIGMRSVTSGKVLPPEANVRNKAETAKKGHGVKREG